MPVLSQVAMRALLVSLVVIKGNAIIAVLQLNAFLQNGIVMDFTDIVTVLQQLQKLHHLIGALLTQRHLQHAPIHNLCGHGLQTSTLEGCCGTTEILRRRSNLHGISATILHGDDVLDFRIRLNGCLKHLFFRQALKIEHAKLVELVVHRAIIASLDVAVLHDRFHRRARPIGVVRQAFNNYRRALRTNSADLNLRDSTLPFRDELYPIVDRIPRNIILEGCLDTSFERPVHFRVSSEFPHTHRDVPEVLGCCPGLLRLRRPFLLLDVGLKVAPPNDDATKSRAARGSPERCC
mmetsp:Transcript_77104/g.124789  ORF Transcript_77104/g.124789 Transcript_77104/m.124789 type:complete len:293 (+) Transcript_77104:141-1019(+)